MSSATKRLLLQGIPLACLILTVGLARQYASGAGIFEPAGGLVARAQEILTSVQQEILPPQVEAQNEPTVPSAPLSADALQRELAAQATVSSPAAFAPLPAAVEPFNLRQPAFGHCRH